MREMPEIENIIRFLLSKSEIYGMLLIENRNSKGGRPWEPPS